MQLSQTSSKILSVLFNNPEQSYYINELVRNTALYPNSVYRALQTLEKQNIVTHFNNGKFKFFKINSNYKFLPQLKEIINKETGNSSLKTGWVKLLNREVDYAFTISVCTANNQQLKEIYGVDVPTYWYNSVTAGVYYIQEELQELGKQISNLIKKDLNFALKDINYCRNRSNKLIKISEEIFKENLKDKTNSQLYKTLQDFNTTYLNLFPFLTTPHAIERYFERKIKESVSSSRDLEILLSPVYVRNEEMESILKIAVYAKKNGFDKHYEKMLTNHWENFCWLPLWSLKARILSRDYFVEEVKNILSHKNPQKELTRMESEEKEKINTLNKTLNKIKASNTLKTQVKFLQEYMYLRTFRKNAICKAHYYHLPLLRELAYRMRITEEEITYLSYQEILSWLTYGFGKKFGYSYTSFKSMISKRISGWAVLMVKGNIKTILGTKNIIQAMEQYHIIHMMQSQPRVVTGRVASRGKVRGRVKIVRKLDDLNKVEKGDVLVAKMTTPDYMIAINKAVAIVTDEGGITCHAAIVSREFGIPCITGTKIATKTLSDGELVEVDAFEGKVRVLESIDVPEDIKIISGKTIYKGKVKGYARIVLDSADFQKVKPGDILITSQTTPEYLSTLYRVKGFIADEDSLTSHAVVYGKALEIPSVMATQFARSVIQDGEKIELNATDGFIRRLT